jgi:hypothetical protein
MRYYYISFIALVVVALIGLTGCDDSTGPGDPGNGAQQQIAGTWVGIFEQPVSDPMFMECDAMFARFEGSDFVLISFDNGDQVNGMKGTFTFEGRNELVLTMNDVWIAHASNWASEVDESLLPGDAPYTLDIDISADGNTLTVDLAGTTGAHEFSKRALSVPDNLAGSWGGHGMVISISSTGEFVVNTSDGMEAGTIHSIDDIGGTDYLLINMTESMDAGEFGYDVYQLLPYEVDAGGTELVIHAGDDLIVLSPLVPVDGSVLIGSWFGILDRPIQGPAERTTDALYFEFEGPEFLLLSFLESDPAAGHSGTYSFEYQGALNITPNRDWDPTLYNWITVDEHTATLPLVLSSDGNTMSFIDWQNNVLFEMYRQNRTIPEHLAGTWAYIEGGVQYASFTVEESGEFVWDQGGEIQSGSLRDIGETEGAPYLLVNITYCDFEIGGAGDYYVVNRYSVDGASFTLWHGDESFTLERQ